MKNILVKSSELQKQVKKRKRGGQKSPFASNYTPPGPQRVESYADRVRGTEDRTDRELKGKRKKRARER